MGPEAEQILQALQASRDSQEMASLFAGLSKAEKLDLLERFKSVKTADAGRFLNMLYPAESDREIQKSIKRLLFRLKSMGIAVEEPAVTGEPVLKRIEEKRDHRGYMSNYDGEGIRLIIAAFEARRNMYILLHTVTHFSRGLLELTSAPVEKRNLETIVNQYRGTTDKPFFFADIDPRYAVYLIEEASGYSGKFTEEVDQVRQFASGLKGTVQHPHDIYRLSVPEETEAAPIEKIFTHKLLTSFTLTWNSLEADRKAYQDLTHPSIILPPHMIEEKKLAFLRDLTEGPELQPKLQLVKRMAEDYAYIFHSTGDFGPYKGLVDVLKTEEGPRDILIYYATKSLETTEEKQTGVLVNPYG